MEDIVCPACHAENDAEARFCDQCAQRLAESGAAAPDGACPACGGKVDESDGKGVCRDCGLEFAPAAADEPAPTAGPAPAKEVRMVPCPLCGVLTSDEASQCASCGVWYDAPRKPVPCPRCGQPAGPDDCACGAILTLDKLIGFLEPAVRFVCLRCKTPYARAVDPAAPKCPGCGGGLTSADRIKAYARGEAAR